MVQLVYASAAKAPFSPEDLKTLLRDSRLRNSVYSVTGMLLYDNGSFLQALEGPARSVDVIFNSIQHDRRHTGLKVLLRLDIPRRDFSEWSMGFVDRSTSTRQPDGFLDYRNPLPLLAMEGTRAMHFMRFFRDGLCREVLVPQTI